MTRKLSVRTLCAAGAALFTLHPAFAAEAAGEQGSPNTQVPEMQVSADAQDSTPGISDIVVTAQRRVERLQDVPIAVTALGGNQLKSAGLTGTQQLSEVTPGLLFSTQTRYAQPVIRGIGTGAASSGDETNVATYIDGVYIPTTIGNFFRLANVERVEVLKGPQGTLFGRNATGGAISITTREPTSRPTLELDGEYGRFNRASLIGYASGGFSDDVAADIAFSYDRLPGIFTLVPQNIKSATIDNVAVRSKLVINASNELKILFSADYSSTNDASSTMFQPDPGTGVKPLGASLGAPIATGDYNYSLSFEPTGKVEQYGGSLTLTYDAPIGTITSISSYRHNRSESRSDFDITSAASSVIEQHTLDRTLQQDLRIASNSGGRFSWLAGVYYFNNHSFYNPLFFNLVREIRTELSTKSIAGYADGTFDFNEHFSLTAGIRYSSETKNFISGSVNGVQLVSNVNKTFESLTPRLIASYKPDTSNLIYASFSRGFKSGQFNTVALQTTPVNPEKLTAYEIGWKSTIANRATLNSSFFYYDYTDFQTQIFDPTRGATFLSNAKSARTYGFDVQLAWQVAGNFRINAGGAYLNAKFTDFQNAPITVPSPTGFSINQVIVPNLKGNTLTRAPMWTGNLGGEYTQSLGDSGSLVFSANGYFNDGFFWDVGNRVRDKSYAILNAQVEWRSADGLYALRAFGRNITDTRYGRFRSAFAGSGDAFTAADPVIYGVGFRIKL